MRTSTLAQQYVLISWVWSIGRLMVMFGGKIHPYSLSLVISSFSFCIFIMHLWYSLKSEENSCSASRVKWCYQSRSLSRLIFICDKLLGFHLHYTRYIMCVPMVLFAIEWRWWRHLPGGWRGMAIDVLQAWWDLRSGMGGDRDNDNERDNDDGRGDNRQRWQRTAVANPLDAQDGGGRRLILLFDIMPNAIIFNHVTAFVSSWFRLLFQHPPSIGPLNWHLPYPRASLPSS